VTIRKVELWIKMTEQIYNLLIWS